MEYGQPDILVQIEERDGSNHTVPFHLLYADNSNAQKRNNIIHDFFALNLYG